MNGLGLTLLVLTAAPQDRGYVGADAVQDVGAQSVAAAEVLPVPVEPDPATHNIDPARIEAAITARTKVILPTRMEDFSITVSSDQVTWLIDLLQNATPSPHRIDRDYPRFAEARECFPRTGARGFDRFARTAAWHNTRQAGLLLV